MLFPLILLAAGAAVDAPPDSRVIEETGLRQLLTLRRVYVDKLTGGDAAEQMREILISSLENTKLFILTENVERADATLRGAAEDMAFVETHSASDSLNARTSAGSTRTSKQQGAYVGGGAGDSESSHSAERRHEALATVRLVNKQGDVIWSTTQESLGARFRGASTDVADKITARLKEDFDRARRLR